MSMLGKQRIGAALHDSNGGPASRLLDPVLGAADAADLRFSSTMRGNNFTRLPFTRLQGRDCPKNIPQWGFPRSDPLAPPP
jgi:hypothetical protein